MRRPASVKSTIISALTATFLLVPLALAAQQQEQQFHRKSPHEQGPAEGSLRSSGSSGHSRDETRLETTQYKHLRDTFPSASAIATLAPAGIDHAVRAPSARGSGKSAGLSSPHIARSLQDWEVEDFILLATVDGSIHARDRRTGAPRWALEVDKPMVETIYHRENRSSVDELRPEDEFLWIVEPSKDGDIYIYNQGRNGGLQRLRLTVKKLVEDLAPYAGEDPAVVYTADKKTTLYTVDAASGQITKVFSNRGSSLSDNNSCRRVSGLEIENLEEEECGSNGLLILGRTEYSIYIHHKETAEPICTLRYSEWGPNNRDSDLHSQYSATMDKKYVYSRHDGSIFAFDHTKVDDRRKIYSQKLSSPVVRVFDVARPLDLQEEKDTQLIILPQPVAPIDDEVFLNGFSDRNRIFLNHTESGGWYAMSEATYPLVTGGAATAQCYSQDWLETKYPFQSIPLDQRQEALIGVHAVSSEVESRAGSFMTISGPESEPINDTPATLQPDQSALPPSVFGQSYILGRITGNSTDILLILFSVMALIFVFINRRILGTELQSVFKLRQSLPAADEHFASVPSSPMVPEAPWHDAPEESVIQQVEEIIEQGDGDMTPTITRSNTLLEPPDTTRGLSSSVDDERGRSKGGARVRIIEPSPSPAPEGEEIGPGSPQTEKKKARRGCRGGVKHKKKRSSSKKGESENVDQAVEEIMQITREPFLEPDVVTVNGIASGTRPDDVTDISGPVIQIGHLKVYTDTVLGFGSHGTVVYKGSFGGRDVAVKRMLLEFYDIASHEVGLLQESDDHPNVIRYFDKESAGEFLYIALELCPASLQDVIEKPVNYPLLIGSTGLDLPDVLKQITSGVRYLHSLKIVHRDIKPQNILVSAPKKLPAQPELVQPPRLLISDFGLCKKLEGDQSSFRATTAHAAGTSGWRAPELLVDEDAAPQNSTTSTTTDSSTNNEATITGHSGSEPAVLDPQTNRRATRAIDIFSLGCVFYYVLTGGNHPFDRDGKYMREANIVKGNYNLSDLANLGDYQWEAKDLIGSMLSHTPRNRPDAGQILCHPFFWGAEERLEFLCHVSDQFEFEPRDPPSSALRTLESYADSILNECGMDFLRVLPKEFKDTLGKQRKYQGNKLLDLLRALRNKKNHYEDMPENVKEKVGPLPAGYLGFWTRRFPGLLMGCHAIVMEVGWEGKDRFKKFYSGF